MAHGSFSGDATRPTPPGWSAGLLPAVFVLTFVQLRYVPSVTVHGISVGLADIAMLATVIAALRFGHRANLARSRVVWATAGLFIAYVLLDTLLPVMTNRHYHVQKHLITWAKFSEYAFLAPASAMLLGRRGGLRLLMNTSVALASVAAAVAMVQFAGVDIFASWGAGNRQPSFTGVHELGALGGAALAVGILGLLSRDSIDRRIVRLALVAGALCAVLSGAIAAGIGVAGAGTLAIAIALRRHALGRASLLAIVAIVAATEIGIVAMRGGDIAQFGRYVGVANADSTTNTNVQTYAQRTLLVYIGLRVWRAHPVVGAGWHSISEPSVFEPQLAAARARFPDQPPLAFPSRQHPWGIDNAYIEALAELGAVGLLLLLAMIAAGVARGLRVALGADGRPAALLGLMWITVAAGVWAGQGLEISPFADLFWFGLGLVAVSTAELPRVRHDA